jgi:hypothetical protein
MQQLRCTNRSRCTCDQVKNECYMQAPSPVVHGTCTFLNPRYTKCRNTYIIPVTHPRVLLFDRSRLQVPQARRVHVFLWASQDYHALEMQKVVCRRCLLLTCIRQHVCRADFMNLSDRSGHVNLPISQVHNRQQITHKTELHRHTNSKRFDG